MAVEEANAAQPEAVGPEAVERRPAPALGRLLRLEPRLAAIGLLGGVLSGLLGVGGGVIMVPLLVLWAGYEQREAHAASLGAIIPISIAGILTFGVAGAVHVPEATGLACGSIVGARLGAGMLARLEERRLKLVFGVFLVAVATLMMVRR
jgi:uncharacterized protein